MNSTQLRVYLTGGLALVAAGRMVDERRFPARQGRRAFAYLVCHRRQAVSRDALAEAVWGEALPAAWESSLNALVSKLRRLFTEVGLKPQTAAIAGHTGYYRMHLPPDAWVDTEAALSAIDVAEGALRSGQFERALASGSVAVTIARRPFLVGEEGEWIELQRTKLRRAGLLGLECMAAAFLGRGEPGQAAQFAAEAVAAQPLREIGYQLLIRAHSEAGNRAEALQVYDRCRRTLGEELGADPSPETEALYLQALGAR